VCHEATGPTSSGTDRTPYTAGRAQPAASAHRNTLADAKRIETNDRRIGRAKHATDRSERTLLATGIAVLATKATVGHQA
jgi:hypothetical protein